MTKFTKKQLKELIKEHTAYVEYLEGQLDNDLSFYEYCECMDYAKKYKKMIAEDAKRGYKTAFPAPLRSYDIVYWESFDMAVIKTAEYNHTHPYPMRQAFVFSSVGN